MLYLVPLARILQSDAFVGHLVHPDAMIDGGGPLHRPAFFSGLGSGGRLAAELLSGVTEAVESLLVVEDEDAAELLDAEANAGLGGPRNIFM